MAQVGYTQNVLPPQTNQRLRHTASIAAAPGDLCYVSDETNGYVNPASQLTDLGTAALTQRLFASRFAGVSASRQAVTNSTAQPAAMVQRIVITGYPCASDTYQIGDFVTPTYSSGLSNQSLSKTTDPTLAIGKVTQAYSVATTSIEVEFFGLELNGGIDARLKNRATARPANSVSAAGETMQYTGGDGFPTTSSSASAGGPANWRGGNGGAATSGTAGASGGVTIGGAVGGAATTGTPGAAGTITIAGDVGGAATAGTGNGGAGGNVAIAGGAGGTSFGGTAGARGVVTVTGAISKAGSTAVAITGATTLTQADSGGIFTVSQAAAYDVDLPSPTTGPGLRFFFSLTAAGANNVTLTVAGGAATFVGSITIDAATVVATGSTLTFPSGASSLGDSIEIQSIATNLYHVRAISSTSGGITIS